VQTNANKNKQNSFHLLAFIFANRDFSKGYGQRNKKSTRVSGCVQNVSDGHFYPHLWRGQAVGRVVGQPENPE
jgi:hypothetical protein